MFITRLVTRIRRLAAVAPGRLCGSLWAMLWHKVLNQRAGLRYLLKAYIQFVVYRYRYEPSLWQLHTQKQQARKFPYTPLISVLIPVYQVPKKVLQALLVSLERQTYPNWQACIVWGDSNNLIDWQWLQTRCGADCRFTLKWLSQNGGISRNSNAALTLAIGDYAALLDHDDELTPWALFEVVKALQRTPRLDGLYSDQDLITVGGFRCPHPFFRPGWSPEMLNSANYLTHLNIIRTPLLRDIGGWRPETDGAQDWDLFLRLGERTQHIGHIPSILYHWRMLPTSTALNADVKPYVPQAQLKTLQDAFLRRGLMPSVIPEAGRFHIHWPVKPCSTDIVIFQQGALTGLINMVEQVGKQSQALVNRLIVVHTPAATDHLAAFRGSWGDRWVTVCHPAVNWRIAVNAIPHVGMAQTLLLIDSSATKLSDNLLQELSGWVSHHPDVAWASALAVSLNEVIYEAGRVVSREHHSAPLFHGWQLPTDSPGYLGAPSWYRNASAVSAYAVALCSDNLPSAIMAITAEDEQTAFTQLCLALRINGKRGLVNPFAKIYFDQPPEHNWLNEGKLYHEDPYFHPALTQVSPFKL